MWFDWHLGHIWGEAVVAEEIKFRPHSLHK
nr:MAG TPA: hypothetical protein [Caudoviricetes sp.]